MASTSDEVVVDIETLTLVNSMERSIGIWGRRSENRKGYQIRRVLPSLRRDCEEDYEPKIISIGPLHRNNEALKPMEALKWEYLGQLIRRNPERNKLEKYIRAVHSVKEDAMKSYEPDELGAYCNNLDGGFDDFVEMMVLDGCFLIEYLVKQYCGENTKFVDVDEANQRLPPLRRDLLLLENQIPFFILQTLFNSTNIPRFRNRVTLRDLADSFVTMDETRSVSPIVGPTIHLLHVYHASLRPPKPPNYPGWDGISPYTSAKKKMMRRIRRLAAAPFLLLLSCLLTCKKPTNFWGYRSRVYCIPETVRMGVPPATQLYNLGVNFKKKVDTTQCYAIFDEGILELPMFSVNQASISTFRNLMAFEEMYPTRAANYINSHAVLMSTLVSAAEDVAMLRDSGIIQGLLEDGQVVQLFAQLRSMGSYLEYDDYFRNLSLFADLRNYCNTAHNKWRADFKRTYFGSPWTVASMIAAAYILLLASAQTFYTIYAYHHPPSS